MSNRQLEAVATVEQKPEPVPFFRPPIGDGEVEAAMAVLRSGWLTTGPKAREFEEKFAEYLGGDGIETIAVNSCTAGLHLAAEACGIGPGDAVLVPTLTFTATAAVIRYLGAEPVLVDVDETTRTIDLEHAKRCLTPNCKAIMPVHFGGYPCDMDAIADFARRHGLKVIEDAAHAIPARHNGKLIGTFDSEATCYSFYANKTITTGEGGMIAIRDPKIADRARKMRTHGLNRDAFDRFRKVGSAWAYDIVDAGFKYNLTDMAAAIGVVQLGRAWEFQEKRQRIAERYLERLGNLPISLPPRAPEGGLHSWHLFPISLHSEAKIDRDELIAVFTREGIGTSVHYRPLHEMTFWRDNCRVAPGGWPNAERYFNGAVSLPLFPDMSDEQIDRVCDVLRESIV